MPSIDNRIKFFRSLINKRHRRIRQAVLNSNSDWKSFYKFEINNFTLKNAKESSDGLFHNYENSNLTRRHKKSIANQLEDLCSSYRIAEKKIKEKIQ